MPPSGISSRILSISHPLAKSQEVVFTRFNRRGRRGFTFSAAAAHKSASPMLVRLNTASPLLRCHTARVVESTQPITNSTVRCCTRSCETNTTSTALAHARRSSVALVPLRNQLLLLHLLHDFLNDWRQRDIHHLISDSAFDALHLHKLNHLNDLPPPPAPTRAPRGSP